MTVKELIKILKAMPQDAAVTTWDGLDDCETHSVTVTLGGPPTDTKVLISNC